MKYLVGWITGPIIFVVTWIFRSIYIIFLIVWNWDLDPEYSYNFEESESLYLSDKAKEWLHEESFIEDYINIW